MKTTLQRILLGSLILFWATGCIAGRPISMGNPLTPSLAPMLKDVLPSVVNIDVRGEFSIANLPMLEQNKGKSKKNIPFNPKFEDLGSGVIIDADKGYIITNAHVIRDADSITVTLKDGRTVQAKVIGFDVPSDIAVIQIKTKRLTAITIGDSDKLNVGDFVCAIGSPFGLEQTVTSGVISGLERSNLGIEGYENFIQTDAPINPGNSGGALLNMKGELIGINTAIIAPAPGSAGIGLAIPSNMAKGVTEQLIKFGKVKRGIMGVMVQEITPALAEVMGLKNTEGALISQALQGTPAYDAGLHSKDVIVKINDKPVHSATQVSNTISLMQIGSEAHLQVIRSGKPVDLKVKIADPEVLKKEQIEAPKLILSGLALKDFSQLIDNEQISGVQVLYVDDSSVAYSSGLRAGDVILSAQNHPVTTISELQEAAHKNPQQLLLEVKRGMGGSIFLVLEE
jgi:serine protease Do